MLLLLIFITIDFGFVLSRQNEIIFIFGTLFIAVIFFCFVSTGITTKNIYEVPDNVDFLEDRKSKV